MGYDRAMRCFFYAFMFVWAARVGMAQVTDQDAREAIRQGVEFLRRQQKSDGSWQEHGGQPGGVSGLCALALLNAGEDPKSPELRKALTYLRSVGESGKVYSTSLQTMVFCIAEPNTDKPAIVRNVQWLEKAQIKDTARKGAWGYDQGSTGGDASNSQFAVLALHEAERVGVPVNPETWKLALEYWLRNRREDGSWGYFADQPSTGSMTCAGIASVIMCSGHLSAGDSQVVGGKVQCCGSQVDNEAVERGLKWLGDKFSPSRNPGSPDSWWYYYLYGVERVGRMSGRRFLGNHDWFREGAQSLIAARETIGGRWVGERLEDSALVATPMALLFLSKGRRPVLLSKLRHSGADWDLHRAGVQHLTSRVEQRWKRDLTWQSINLSAATADDLAESPVLFLSGRDGLRLSNAQEQNLRLYVNRGGVIFAEACCGGAEFDRDFRALMQRLFPDSPLRLLPPDHPVWFAEQTVNPELVKPLFGIDACCRTSVVYCPDDLSCYWELSRGTRQTDYPERVKQEVEAALRIGANVLTYATNRELRNKLDRPQFAGSERVEGLDRGTLHMPKLRHGGGSDDAPNALPNMLQFVRMHGQFRVAVENRLISATDPSLFEYPIVFLHGRRAFRWTPEERKALALFVERGGVLFADAICASPQFTDSLRREIEAIFPGQSLARIDPSHPLFTRSFRGFDLPKVTLRDPRIRGEDSPLRADLTQVTPVLEGLTIDDRIVMIFSPYDLSCAMESGASLECKGYAKEDAARLIMNVVMFALQQ